MSFLRRHSLFLGILLMFAITWTVHLSNAGVLPLRIPFPLSLLGGWGFAVAAIIMTWLTLGTAAVGALLRRFLLWRIGWKWYASLLIIPGAYLLGMLSHALVTGVPPDFTKTTAHAATGSYARALVFLLPVFFADVLGNGEECGWRGFVLPRLQARYSALYSALVVGLIWAVWHLAVYIRSFNPAWYPWYVISVMAKSVLIAWAYNGSRGSLLLATLYHAMWNTAAVSLPLTGQAAPGDIGIYAYVVMAEVAVAAMITALAGPEHLSHKQARQVQG